MSSVKGSPHRSKDQLVEQPQTPQVEPLGPYTPEAANSIASALQARETSSGLRRSVNETIKDANQLQHSTHFSVNHGLTQKVAETVNIKVKLPGFFMFHPLLCLVISAVFFYVVVQFFGLRLL